MAIPMNSMSIVAEAYRNLLLSQRQAQGTGQLFNNPLLPSSYGINIPQGQRFAPHTGGVAVRTPPRLHTGGEAFVSPFPTHTAGEPPRVEPAIHTGGERFVSPYPFHTGGPLPQLEQKPYLAESFELEKEAKKYETIEEKQKFLTEDLIKAAKSKFNLTSNQWKGLIDAFESADRDIETLLGNSSFQRAMASYVEMLKHTQDSSIENTEEYFNEDVLAEAKEGKTGLDEAQGIFDFLADYTNFETESVDLMNSLLEISKL